ncbi:ornithine cyclodeaminase family protein [Chitinophaga nivalis]|uniref:Ornithine cyclodeaminase family protein n=1 Tax=Chitinophaga nivalis TaxID=2991709 RepID=A0ABT3IMJ6_9BACT|nr:ornithine cyclodeaminase family protein [Chitinophaga nivalis]MCW3465134.1 ornithine cyclodeaminase family protein [Chitinophaga nivalis]MCW3485174.1 ornithine cyclodeaminase family protein [Chitinophaga nivalis]
MLVLNNHEIAGLLSLDEVIAAVEAALIANEQNSCLVPKRMHIDWGENTFLSMPSFSDTCFGTKLVSVVPGNRQHDLAVTNGAMLLNDARTGFPLAIMNGAKLTALRTGALGAIGIKYMTPPDTDTIGLIGCGVQGIQQAIFACAVRPVKKIYCLQRSASGMAAFTTALREQFPAVTVIPCEDAATILQHTNVVIAASRSATPVLPNDIRLLENKHFISIGSYKPDMQELPDLVFQLSGKLAIDSVFAKTETGDIINPLRKGILQEQDVFTIGKILTGEIQVDVAGTTAYKSAGMALFDLFVAKALYETAKSRRIGTDIDF